jgi:hypothetical protein
MRKTFVGFVGTPLATFSAAFFLYINMVGGYLQNPQKVKRISTVQEVLGI